MATSTPKSGRSVAARPHLLIVSDDADLAAFLGEGLLLAGFWTSVVASAIQALEVFRLRSFDLVLIDAALAGVGGLELTRRLRGRSDRAASDRPRTDVPIMLVTGAAGTVTPEAAAAAGADAVLDPPLELEELAPRLFTAVAAWRATHPDRPWADATAMQKGRDPR